MAIAGREGRLQTQTLAVDDLVGNVRDGVIRIPSFQRGLRWQRKDVLRLFDSIVNGYPIGNLLLWQRSATEDPDLKIGAMTIDAPALEQALFVVDGQQRLTSLANALTEQGHSDSRFALSYDVLRQEFVPRSENNQWQIPLPVIFDLSRLLHWFSDHPELLADAELIDRANRVAKAVREFRVPVYIVDRPDPNVLRDIFDRMNNYGKQLTRAEVFTALNESETGEKESGGSTPFGDIAAEVHSATGFGVLDEDTVFLSFLARRGPDVSRDIRREFVRDETSIKEFSSETAEDAHRRLVQALVDAIFFLQNDAGVPHFALLPYRYLLVILVRFFAHFPEPTQADRRSLRRWFWRASLRGPEYFKGSSTGATRAIATKIKAGDVRESVSALLSQMQGPIPAPPSISVFKTNYSATRLLMNALWALKPKRLSVAGDGYEYSLEDLLGALGESSTAVDQAVQIFSSSSLSVEYRAMAANRLFVPVPAQLMPENPSGVLTAMARTTSWGHGSVAGVLRTFAIDEEAAGALANGDAVAFIELRQRYLTRIFSSFLESRAEWAFEDTPPLASLDLDSEEFWRDDSAW